MVEISTSFETEFVRLRGDWSRFQQQRTATELAAAPHFNVFRLLDLERYEVRLHSRLLRDLLNPSGSHGQGIRFLKSFLELIVGILCVSKSRLFAPLDPYLGNAGIDGWHVGPEGQIDIAIRNRSARLLIFIENKIDHYLRPSQLLDYRMLLEREQAHYPRQCVVLLSRGKLAGKEVAPADACLTYMNDVSPWLRQFSQVEPISLRGTLQQYIDVIENFDGRGKMEDQDIALLAQRENIRCALDVAQKIESVKAHLRQQFWDNVRDKFQAALDDHTITNNWEIAGIEDIHREPMKIHDVGVYLRTKSLRG